MSKEKLSAKRITIWICVNYGIFILGFFILGSTTTNVVNTYKIKELRSPRNFIVSIDSQPPRQFQYSPFL